MRKILVLIFLCILLIGSVSAQSATSSPSAPAGFLGTFATQTCSALYSNQVTLPPTGGSDVAPTGGGTAQIFPSVFVNGNLGLNIAELALLVVLAVFCILALAYGIGYGFGISKLVQFARTEALESVLNIILIGVIAGSLAATSSYAGFFGSLASSYSSQPSPQFGTALYTGICQNIINTQIGPSISTFILTLANLPLYSLIGSLSLTTSPATPGLSNFVPTITFKPLDGVQLYYQLVVFLLLPLSITLFLGVTTNFLLLTIYFLFPAFLYLGVLLRSFPWTRAAGGALLALFISFYIIFPALYYPVTALASSQIYTATNSACIINSPNSGFGNCQSSSGIYSWFLTHAISILTFIVSLPFLNPGQVFIQLIDAYISYIATAVLNLIGFSIALLISFDLLEALGDFLGSPSLTSGRLLERLI
jgi:hypothetical protein